MIPLHTRQVHPVFVPGCFGCKVATVGIPPSVASSTPGGDYVNKVKAFEKVNDRDTAAYKALRADGLQPKQITGCHDAVRSGATSYEIMTGQRFDRQFGSLATTMRREVEHVVPDHPHLLDATPIKREVDA